MFDLSSRTIQIRSATGSNVGPSTYVLCEPRCQKKNCAPFLSSQTKSSSILTKLNTDAIYDTRDFRDKIKGGASLRNKASRFIYKSDDTPGPTRYEARPIQWVKKKLKLDPKKPKLYACAVPYSIADIAPTIPTKINENGYDIDKDGNLVRVPPTKKKPIELEFKSTFPSEKGWRWSCRSSTRFDEKKYKTAGPGPAAYSIKVPKCKRFEEDEKFREMARLFTFIPRYVEEQEIKATREALPGPGAYDVLTFEGKEWNEEDSRSFLSSAPRFKYDTSDTPGPTKYNVCDCATKSRKFSVKCVPFGFESARFRRKKIESTPGPASYSVKGALQEKIEKKKNPYSLFEPPFNTTAKRNFNTAKADAEFTPSAADYPEDKEGEVDVNQTGVGSSVFMDGVERFWSPTDKKDFMGPAKYNVCDSFNNIVNQKSHNCSEVPFNSTGARSRTPQIRTGVPCPTSYENAKGLSCKGYRFATSPRFPCIPEENPGPGAYTIHPRLEKSTYKASDTHNLRLKENVLHKKLRQAPRETRKLWMKTMKKRKLLKWFDVELDYEERMILLIQELFDKPV